MRRERDNDTSEYPYFDYGDDTVESAGLMDTIMDVGVKAIGKLTGETAKTLAKEICKKVAKKAFEKGTEKVGIKLGEVAGDKIINALTKKEGGRLWVPKAQYNDLRYKFRRTFNLTN